MAHTKKSILFIPHGGGPLPLIDHEPHRELTSFLKQIPESLGNPKAIVVITAHWEAPEIQVATAAEPGMLFDYYGFPPETYQYSYPAKTDLNVSQQIIRGLNDAGISAIGNDQRGYDHGTFVPLMLMYPAANIPVIQMSLHSSLDAEYHIRVGEVLGQQLSEDILILGSGLSFHNMQATRVNMSTVGEASDESKAFDDWLHQTFKLPSAEARTQLAQWQQAPFARFCHPREEHLLPLLVTFGASIARGKHFQSPYSAPLLGSQVSAFYC